MEWIIFNYMSLITPSEIESSTTITRTRNFTNEDLNLGVKYLE